jgi:pimeloyl-ACP methyl ester carboxylesterase
VIERGRVVSSDGTPIAYERAGSGPPLVLVGGGLDDGAENAPLVPLLAQRFTVCNYARRGRGGSGDTPPYDVRREIEDLDALIADLGGRAHVYGVSSGGALALEAAAAGSAIDGLAVYEVPYPVGAEATRRWRDYVDALTALLAAGRRSAAVELFMGLAGAPEEEIAAAPTSPLWPRVEALAPTLAYDAACLGSGVPRDRLAGIARPTLVVTGGSADPHMSELQPGYFDDAADAVAAAVPGARRHVLAGQSHVPAPEAVAELLAGWFTGGRAAAQARGGQEAM